jgi:hypothetical protein
MFVKMPQCLTLADPKSRFNGVCAARLWNNLPACG